MGNTFVTELLVLAMYGELLHPPLPVRFLLPYSSLEELYMLLEEPSADADPPPEEQTEMLAAIRQLLQFVDTPFVQKKIDRVLNVPWAVSAPIIYNEQVTFQFVNALDTAAYGEELDPIETELIEIASRHAVPLLTEDPSMHQRIVQYALPIQVYDVADYEFALEDQLPAGAFAPSQFADSRTDEGNGLVPFILLGSALLVLIISILSTLT